MNQMKNKIIYFFVILFSVAQVSGQTYSEEQETESEAVTLNGTSVSEGMFSSFFNTNNNQTTAVEGSSVFLTQIGEANKARVAVSAEASDINVLQNGNQNEVDLQYDVKTVAADLEQNGDNNYLLDYTIDPSQNISLDVTQNGDNLNFERFGTNELSKNIKFTQTAASPTIIIRSFK